MQRPLLYLLLGRLLHSLLLSNSPSKPGDWQPQTMEGDYKVVTPREPHPLSHGLGFLEARRIPSEGLRDIFSLRKFGLEATDSQYSVFNLCLIPSVTLPAQGGSWVDQCVLKAYSFIYGDPVCVYLYFQRATYFSTLTYLLHWIIP